MTDAISSGLPAAPASALAPGQMRRLRAFVQVADALEQAHAEDRVEVFSFDVFDTLIFRRCAPETVLYGVAVALRQAFPDLATAAPETILAARDEAYRELARQSVAAGRDPDALLPALCAAWAARLRPRRPAADVEALAGFIERTEIQYESWSCLPNPDLQALCRRLHARGHRLVYVSDMYLGRPVIERLLADCGYDGLFAAGYVSGDLGLLKRTGRLYDHVLQAEGVQAARVCHVGDDELADGRRAAERGLRAWFVRDPVAWRRRSSAQYDRDRLRHERAWLGVVAHDFAAAEAARSSRHGYGLQLLGTPIAVFLHGLAQYCERQAIERVFFLSREGFVLREIYDELVATLGLEAPRGDYLCVSRLTTGLAAMRQFGLREVNAAVAASAEVTPRRVLAQLRLPEADLQRAAAASGIPDLDAPCEVNRSPALGRLLRHPLVVEAAAEKGERSRAALVDYLTGQGFFGAGRVAIVDVGWGAQIQENIELAIEGDAAAPEIHGFYLGIDRLATERRRAGCRIRGAFIDPQSYEWSGGAALDFVHLFEILTRAPHGTVVAYADSRPQFAESGAPERAGEEHDDDAIVEVQQGLMQHGRHYARAMRMLGGSWTDAEGFARTLLCRMIRFPRPAEIDLLIGLKNISHLGSAETLALGRRQSAMAPRAFWRVVNRSLWSEGVAAHGMGRLGSALLAILKAARIARRLPPQEPDADRAGRAAGRAAPGRPAGPSAHPFEQAIRDRLRPPPTSAADLPSDAFVAIRSLDLAWMWGTWYLAGLYLRLRGLPRLPADMLSLRAWLNRELHGGRRRMTAVPVRGYRALRRLLWRLRREGGDG